MTRSSIIAVAALGLTLTLGAGCAGSGGPRWSQPGADAEQLQRDQDDCMSKATIGADPGALDPQSRATVQRDFENCMHSRGWTRVSKP